MTDLCFLAGRGGYDNLVAAPPQSFAPRTYQRQPSCLGPDERAVARHELYTLYQIKAQLDRIEAIAILALAIAVISRL